MKIAVLGWGSLIWNPDGLALATEWSEGGPVLPIEFSRVSSDGRLTLVIDESNGACVVTRYAVSEKSDLNSAIEDLRRREGPTRRENIGGIAALKATTPAVASIPERIADWCADASFDAAIWTALPANFQDKLGVPFSVQTAMAYLIGLSGCTKRKAFEYVVRAPEEVQTPLRAAFMAAGLAHAE